MRYPLTLAVLGGMIASLLTLCGPAWADSAAEDPLAAPPAAAGRPLLPDPDILLRPQTYPGLPDTDPFSQDPEQRRAELRQAVATALAEQPELTDTPILVHVTSLHRARLQGVVHSEADRILAEIVAADVPGISGVDNSLRVESSTE